MDSAAFLAAACLVLLAFSFLGNQKTKQRLTRLEEEVARLSGRPAGVAGSPYSVSNPVDPTVPGMTEVLELIRAKKKIQAIKRYRELTGASLKDAKDAVDHADAFPPL